MLLLAKIFTMDCIKYRNCVAMNRFAFITLALSLLCTCNAGTENLTHPLYSGIISTSSAASAASATGTASGTASVLHGAGARTLLRIYDDCTRADFGFVPCLKKKAISFIDRISYIDAITIADGVKLIRLPGAGADPVPLRPFSENELESTVSSSRSYDDRDTKLTHALIERLSHFFNGHTIQVNFPKLSTEEIGRGLEEGRGKMKKMMSMMVMGMAMKMMGMIPIAMGALYMMAGKALIVSKIALLLAGIMGLKKLMSGRGGSGGGSGWASGGGAGGWSSGGGGYDRRSMNEVHDLAYRSYSQQQNYAPQYQQQKQQKQQQQQYEKRQPLQQKENEEEQQTQQQVEKS